eukprot:Opistho-1_new@95548
MHRIAGEAVLRVAEVERAEHIRHAPFGDHRAGEAGRLHDVVRSAGADLVIAEDQLFGDAATERHGDVGVHLVAVIAVAVTLRQRLDHAERKAARDDRGLVDRIGGRLVREDQGVACLVIGGHPLLVLGHHHRPAFGAHQHLVARIVELARGNQPLALACGEQGRLVDEVGEIGTRKARRPARDHARIDVGRQRHLLHMDLKDLDAAFDIGARHLDLAVEAARTQQRRIEHVGAVGRGDDDDAFIGIEPVHLDQQLVQRLLALVIAAAETGATMATDRIDFVDEDDAGGTLLGLLEHVAHAARAHAHEHLDEVGARDGEERHVGFARDGARQQRLTGARRADQQAALGDLAAQTLDPCTLR